MLSYDFTVIKVNMTISIFVLMMTVLKNKFRDLS